MLLLIAFFLLFSTNSQGARIYSELSQRCCAGNVVDLPPLSNPGDYSCCGTEVFEWQNRAVQGEPSPLVSRCCEGKLYRNVSQTSACCETKLYQPANQTCYKWSDDESCCKVLPLSPENIEKGRYFVCGKTSENGSYYDVLANVCCSGVLYRNKVGMECCGDQYIDTTIAKCCHEYVAVEGKKRKIKKVSSVVHHNGVLPPSPKCCNGSLINTKNQECCKGVVANMPEGFDWRTSPFCCGTQLILDRKSQECVNERVVAIVAHSHYQVLCGGELHPINDPPANVYCINDTRLVQMKRNEFMCRINETYKKFAYEEKVCGFNELVNISEEDRSTKRLNVCYRPEVEDSTIEWPHSVV